MPPVAVPLTSRARLVACAGMAAVIGGVTVAGVAACGTPPELRPRPGSSVPRPSTSPSPAAQPSPPTSVVLPPGETALASPTPSFAEQFATPCNDYPSGSQVIALVRRTNGLLPRGAAVTVSTGPLCAGTWQYTVLAVAQQEPLLVVTRGAPASLTLVTAGTDVCSIPVRTAAPPGILNAALCPEPGA